MCGIVGFSGFEDKVLLKRMMQQVEHRGPDQSGTFADRSVSLGHRRLSIIDLSEKGRQPIPNEDKSVWVVFNGEIYNYQELRKELIKKGHRFYSQTDTEVIVHSYEEFGENCPNYFNGCFAFAVYDQNKKSLFLARDRLGIKPLYYTLKGNHFYFASEIKAILESPEIKREVNVKALNYYLSFFANPLTETMFKGIYKLAPGQTLIFQSGKIKLATYWDIYMKPDYSQTVLYHKKKLLDLLSDSVQKRLMSNVPVGAYLSGGIDSASVVYFMSRGSDKVKTFTVGFDADPAQAELKRANRLAKILNTEHQEIIVSMESIKELPKIVWHQDEPMGDPTSVPTYLLSQQAKKKCTVILTGEGADEQFAGYEQEKFLMLHQQYVQLFPLWLRQGLAYPLQKIPANHFNLFFKYMGSLGEEGKKRLANFVGSNNPTENLLEIISIFNEKEKKEIAGPQLLAELQKDKVVQDIYTRYFRENREKELLNRLLLFENKVLLAENLLMKVDKNTMAWGIEARVPFLDHRVVEFAAQLPPHLKLNGLQDKFLLRKTMGAYLPFKRAEQKKERFFVPVDYWLKHHLKWLAEDLLSKQRLAKQGYFNYNYTQKMFQNYSASPLFYGRQIWTLLNFQLWHKLFIEQEKITF